MKKILLSLSIISVFAACKSSQQKNETETPLLLAPTANYQNSALTDTAQAVIKETANAPKPRVIEISNYRISSLCYFITYAIKQATGIAVPLLL